VDILLENNTVIEINNGKHYVYYEDGSKKLDLKSSFRKRILEKLGYRFLEVEVELFVEGNYEFLKYVKDELKIQNRISLA
jgi:hypothetical protein